MPLAFLYDAAEADLRYRDASLSAQLGHAKSRNQWSVQAVGSRNALLESIAAGNESSPTVDSVGVIDLKAETGDLEQTGFRIVETIRRNPQLARLCRPIIWTDRLTVSNARFAASVGAYAIVDGGWVDEGERTRLPGVLDWAIRQPAGVFRLRRIATRNFPSDIAEAEDERTRDERFRSWFGFRPSELHYALLWGLANGVELKFLQEYLAAEGLARSKRSVRRQLERLQRTMLPHLEAFDRPEIGRAEVARRFLAEQIPPEPDPLGELNWPEMSHVRELYYSDAEIVRLAYLEPGAMEILGAFFLALSIPAGSAAAQHQAIREAAVTTATRISKPNHVVVGVVHRAVLAIDDAWCDRRDHGESSSRPAKGGRSPGGPQPQ